MTFKKIAVVFIVIVIVITIVIFFVSNKDEKAEYVTAKIEKGNLKQTVSEVGIVKAVQEIELNFFQSGKVAKSLVSIGDKVNKDQVLAELDYSSLTIKEQEAQANLDIAQANLNATIEPDESWLA